MLLYELMALKHIIILKINGLTWIASLYDFRERDDAM